MFTAAGFEHLLEPQILRPRVLDIVGQRLLHVTHVTRCTASRARSNASLNYNEPPINSRSNVDTAFLE